VAEHSHISAGLSGMEKFTAMWCRKHTNILRVLHRAHLQNTCELPNAAKIAAVTTSKA